MGLSREEMQDAGEVLNESFFSVFGNFPEKVHPKLLSFSIGLAREEIPPVLFSGSADSLKRLISLGMDDTDIRTFLMLLGFHFFSRFGNTKARYAELVENLAQGLGIDSTISADVCALPPDIAERLPTIEDATALLMANRWMVIMALMMLYLKTPQDMEEIYIQWRKNGLKEGWRTE